MTGTVQTLVNAARAEWDHWGRSTWNLANGALEIGHTDDDPEYAQYVIDRYCSVGGGDPTVEAIADDEYYWSAVGISAIFSMAGFSAAEFPFSESHSTWIRTFVRARADNADRLYHAYRLHEGTAVPDVGDMIGYTYDTTDFDEAQTFFDKTRGYGSHTDIVVARRDDEIDVIGANVRDSVTMKTVPLDGNGLVADRTKMWFVVLKRRGF